MNLAGIVIPGERVAAVPGRTVAYCNGLIAGSEPRNVVRPVRAIRRRPVMPQAPQTPLRQLPEPLPLFL